MPARTARKRAMSSLSTVTVRTDAFIGSRYSEIGAVGPASCGLPNEGSQGLFPIASPVSRANRRDRSADAARPPVRQSGPQGLRSRTACPAVFKGDPELTQAHLRRPPRRIAAMAEPCLHRPLDQRPERKPPDWTAGGFAARSGPVDRPNERVAHHAWHIRAGRWSGCEPRPDRQRAARFARWRTFRPGRYRQTRLRHRMPEWHRQ